MVAKFGQGREPSERTSGAPEGALAFGRTSTEPGSTAAGTGDRSAEAGPLGDLVPSLALPKGGGAVRGLGEQFQIAAATGTGSLSIPVVTSPGRGGFGPALSLRYDSGGGNGPFGLGMSLSPPSISRRTDRGMPRYLDREESDVFVLSGAEDLVPMLRSAGDGWERVQREQDGFQIDRYRPRIETDFARIERWRELATGLLHWRVTDRSNVTSIFGRSAAARVANPRYPRLVFRWLLERVFDDRGNVAVYEYGEEDDESAGGLSEMTRLGGVQPQRYLRRIRYGNRTPAGAEEQLADGDWMFEVVLDYGDHGAQMPASTEAVVEALAIPYTADRPWPMRVDPFSSCRSGFEIRTRRLCRRVLMFHRFAQLGTEPTLVASTDFEYDASPVATTLRAVNHRGYVRLPSGEYRAEATPPLRLSYTSAELSTQSRTVDPDSLRDVSGGLDGSSLRLVDLDGDGAPGLLAMQGRRWRYKRSRGGGRFAPAVTLPTMPSGAGSAAAQLADLDGDGRLSLWSLDPATPGSIERTDDGGWGELRLFDGVPIGVSSQRMTLADLTGDGLPDLLQEHFGNEITWWPGQGRAGFGVPRRTAKPHDMPVPQVLVKHPQVLVAMADMTGDGLPDVVRVGNGEVCYWPNLGLGRFGACVRMGGLQPLARPEQMRADRVRLADIDGSGTTDLVYFDEQGAQVLINAAGNRFMPAVRVRAIPPVHTLAHVDVLDLEGRGTSCLVWSSSSPADEGLRVRYVELLPIKPYLLSAVENGRGLETRMSYAPSTKFSLADRAAGRPWITRLPFPVQVLEQVEVIDHTTGHRTTSSYSYHHGYYDGAEREFRGFGLVVHRDAQAFEAGAADPLDVPPVVTKTWFHTGVYLGHQRIAKQLAQEYWAGDPDAVQLPDTVLPEGLRPEESREAVRALKGVMLRQEVYSEDGSDRTNVPYTVIERSMAVRLEQPRAGQRHASLLVHERETLTYHYEREATDPRTQQAAVLDVDRYGVVTRSVAVGYPRRVVPEGRAEQRQTSVVTTDSEVVHVDDVVGSYRLGVPVQSHGFELTGVAGDPTQPWDWTQLAVMLDAAPEVPFETTVDPGDVVRRRLAQQRILYYDNELAGALPFEQVGSRALPYETRSAAMTEAQRDAVFGADVNAALLGTDGGYIFEDGLWWTRSPRQVFDPAKFYLPVEVRDPFEGRTMIDYDEGPLLVTQVVDPADNVAQATYDYRVLSPSMVTDPNANRLAAGYDGLGQLSRTAVLGKIGQAGMDSLEEPTSELSYDLWAWHDHGTPVWMKTRAREHHGADPGRWLETWAYSDGRGQALMVKAPAQPGVEVYDETLPDPVPRWVGSGRTIRNNKGLPVRQYEPFFSTTSGFESEESLVQHGVSPVLHYDPLGRLVWTELPNGTEARVEFSPWEQRSFDANDLVLGSRWYAERMALPVGDPERRAARLTAGHANTPTVTHLDHLGRSFLVIEHNRDQSDADVFSETHATLDVQGNAVAIKDANGTFAEARTVGMLGQVLRTSSIEVGERRAVTDVLGAPLWNAGSRGFSTRHRYDAARRPTHTVVTGPEGSFTTTRIVYGEAAPNAVAANLRGRALRTYDGAGVVEQEAFDVDGNLVRQSRRLAAAYHETPDWSALDELDDPAAMDVATAGSLEDGVFTAKATFDAMGRPRARTTPDASVVHLGYGDAGHLETIAANVRGAEAPTGVVEDLRYDARGRRTLVVYGNGTRTSYAHDPLTLRLTRLRTERIADHRVHQDLRYTHDPVGNITEIRDGSQPVVFTGNAAVDADQRFEYDALYRLVKANGREHNSLGRPTEVDVASLPSPDDPTGLRAYEEQYLYDLVGNILQVTHEQFQPEDEASTGWTRRYQYTPESHGNLLRATNLPNDAENTFSLTYNHDPHGNMTAMPHLADVHYDFADRMQWADLDGGGRVFFTYDAAGQRVRKIRRNFAGTSTWERVYLGGFELYRERVGTELRLERETLHIADDTGRVCMVETKTIDDATPVAAPNPITRYQYGNHLGTVGLELDGAGQLISYEEFHPYGTTAYRAANSAIEVSPNRYRYTGKERDEETGLGYHGARYYASWLGRWTAADPIGLDDGVNRHAYARGRPTTLHDPSGMKATGKKSNYQAKLEYQNRRMDELAREKKTREEAHEIIGRELQERFPEPNYRPAKKRPYIVQGVDPSGPARLKKHRDEEADNQARKYDAHRFMQRVVANSGEFARPMLMGVVGALPIVGIVVDAIDLHHAFTEGNDRDKAMAIMGLVPFLGGLAVPGKNAVRIGDDAIDAGSTTARRLDDTTPAATRNSTDTAVDTGTAAGGRVEPLGRGSTVDPKKGRFHPRNLREKLAIDEAMQNPSAGVQAAGPLGDTRWPASEGWVKYQQTITPGGREGPISVHYNFNTITGAVDDFKIVERRPLVPDLEPSVAPFRP